MDRVCRYVIYCNIIVKEVNKPEISPISFPDLNIGDLIVEEPVAEIPVNNSTSEIPNSKPEDPLDFTTKEKPRRREHRSSRREKKNRHNSDQKREKRKSTKHKSNDKRHSRKSATERESEEVKKKRTRSSENHHKSLDIGEQSKKSPKKIKSVDYPETSEKKKKKVKKEKKVPVLPAKLKMQQSLNDSILDDTKKKQCIIM
jgi:hypothetical protein